MSTAKKILSVLLALIMLTGAFAVPAALAEDSADGGYSTSEKIEHVFYRLVDKIILALGKVLNFLIPGKNLTGKIPSVKNYVPQNFYEGKKTFDAQAPENAKWSMGYSRRSFLDGIDPLDGNYFIAGSLAFTDRYPVKEVLDDQGVSTFVLSDGETTIAYAAVDGYGLSRGDVLEIRGRLAAFAEENDISSINVSVLHQHSCIDTLGFSVSLLPAILKNPLTILFNEDKIEKGKTDAFMEELYTDVTESVKEAARNMVPGSLYFGSVDISEYINDKRDPQAIDPDFERLRFVPDDSSANEIWVCETGIHCVTMSSTSGMLSSDYPYYIRQYVKENTGADLVFIEGAELAISRDTSTLTFDTTDDPSAQIKALGSALGKKLTQITNDKELSPLLNIAHREVILPVDNPIHILAGRAGLLSTVIARRGLDYVAVTEIGYMELGSELGILLVPGEIEPAIIWGGAADASVSWTGKTWDYKPLAETCGADKVICFGLCNDQIGYILPDNDYRSMLTENEEVNAASTRSGSVLTEAFEALIADVK